MRLRIEFLQANWECKRNKLMSAPPPIILIGNYSKKNIEYFQYKLREKTAQVLAYCQNTSNSKKYLNFHYILSSEKVIFIYVKYYSK